jgi:hypothetical protein
MMSSNIRTQLGLQEMIIGLKTQIEQAKQVQQEIEEEANSFWWEEEEATDF